MEMHSGLFMLVVCGSDVQCKITSVAVRWFCHVSLQEY